MGNQYGQEQLHSIYKIISNGNAGAFETAYVLVHVQSFGERGEAEDWISNSGDRHVSYTIIEVFKNR